MGPVEVPDLLPAGRDRGDRAAGARSARARTVPTLGASGAIAGGARRLPGAVPARPRRDGDLHRLLLHDPRAAGAARPRRLVPAAGAVRLLRPDIGWRAAAAWRTSPTSAASSSGCSRSERSRVAAGSTSNSAECRCRAADGADRTYTPPPAALAHRVGDRRAAARDRRRRSPRSCATRRRTSPSRPSARTAPPGRAGGLRHRAAGRRRDRAVAAGGPARPRGRSRAASASRSRRARRCCSTSTPAACSGATTRRGCCRSPR